MWRIIGYLLLAGLVIYIIQLALVVGLILLTVASLIYRPKETLSFLAFVGLLSLLSAYPVQTAVGAGILGIAGYFLRRYNKAQARKASLLPAPDDR